MVTLVNPFLVLAEEAIDYTKKIVIYSSNFPNRDKILENNHTEIISGKVDYELFKLKRDGMDAQLNLIREEMSAVLKEEISPFSQSLPESIKIRFSESIIENFLDSQIASKYSEKYSLGNCGELSAVAFMYLIQKDKKCPVEIFHLEDKRDFSRDHTVVVIGRDPNSDPNKPKLWGNAVICDPWAREAYPASDIRKRLHNFEGCDSKNLHTPKLRKYNPKRHTLEVFTANIFC